MSAKGARITVAVFASIVAVCWFAGTAAADTRAIPSGGTTSIGSFPFGVDGIQQPEFREGEDADEGGGVPNRPRPGFKNGKFPKKPLDAPTVAVGRPGGPNPELTLSFNGLNHRDQRLANGGNQFSLEPPDQALCVGNGFTVESVNSVLRVYGSRDGRAADRCPGPQHVLRLPGRDQPDDRRHRART